MRIILTKDVPTLGRSGEVKDVADGYAQNYLFPRKLAIEATAGALRKAQQEKSSHDAKAARAHSDAEDLAKRLSEITLIFKLKAGEQGKTFGSVTPKEIAEELKRQAKVDIDKTMVVANPIKTLGAHKVEVRLLNDVRAQVTVAVEAA